MKRGDIYWIELPPATGHEQSGRRPAVIVQDETYTARLSTVLIVPLTSNRATTRFPGTTLIHPDGQNGLKVLSVALVFQTRALDKRFMAERIGTLALEDFRGLLNELDRLLGR